MVWVQTIAGWGVNFLLENQQLYEKPLMSIRELYIDYYQMIIKQSLDKAKFFRVIGIIIEICR